MSRDSEEEWAERTKRLFKAELKRADVTYDDLADRLSRLGLPETKASIANKISRGSFSAAFLLASLKAIGCQNLRVEDL